LYRWCRRWGLQEADAQDVTQAVLARLAAKMNSFRYDPAGSFRAYLKTLARYAWCDFLKTLARYAWCGFHGYSPSRRAALPPLPGPGQRHAGALDSGQGVLDRRQVDFALEVQQRVVGRLHEHDLFRQAAGQLVQPADPPFDAVGVHRHSRVRTHVFLLTATRRRRRMLLGRRRAETPVLRRPAALDGDLGVYPAPSVQLLADAPGRDVLAGVLGQEGEAVPVALGQFQQPRLGRRGRREGGQEHRPAALRRDRGARLRPAGGGEALQAAEHVVPQELVEGAEVDALAAQLLGKHTSPTQAAVRAERLLRIQEALNSLDPLDREIISLRHFEQLSRAESAQALGIEESAASKRYIRALKRLKSILADMAGGLEGL
jgi:RNA polymerase sigma factor (sigma-70 family)